MTMNIHLSVDASSPAEMREALISLLGPLGTVSLHGDPGPAIKVPTEPITDEQAKAIVAEATKPKRGKKADAEQVKTDTVDAAQVAALGEAKANISTEPENRIDPENPEAEVQDAADEAAETAAEQSGKPLTREDLKVIMGRHIAKFTMPVTQQVGKDIFMSALGKPPAGEEFWKLSIIPDDQESLQKCAAAWEAAIAKDVS